MNKKIIFLLLIGVLAITGCTLNEINDAYEKDGICFKEYSRVGPPEMCTYISKNTLPYQKNQICVAKLISPKQIF